MKGAFFSIIKSYLKVVSAARNSYSFFKYFSIGDLRRKQNVSFAIANFVLTTILHMLHP